MGYFINTKQIKLQIRHGKCKISLDMSSTELEFPRPGEPRDPRISVIYSEESRKYHYQLVEIGPRGDLIILYSFPKRGLHFRVTEGEFIPDRGKWRISGLIDAGIVEGFDLPVSQRAYKKNPAVITEGNLELIREHHGQLERLADQFDADLIVSSARLVDFFRSQWEPRIDNPQSFGLTDGIYRLRRNLENSTRILLEKYPIHSLDDATMAVTFK